MSLPQPNELEVSIFGSGYGECTVIHLGAGKWMIVDSCLCDDKETPVALEYLDRLKVDVSNDVVLLVVTHWDADHCKGADKILKRAVAADFVVSAAIKSSEFFQLLEAADRRLAWGDEPLEDFGKALHAWQARHKSRKAVAPQLAMASTCIFQMSNPQVQIHALSPSSQAITDALAEHGKHIPQAAGKHKRYRLIKPNETSVTLLVQVGGRSILLGGDLEIGATDSHGWRAVYRSKSRPNVKSQIFKVPHHGSLGANYDPVWEHLLDANPWALLSAHSPSSLPQKSDIKRIRRKTNVVYCTSRPKFSLRRNAIVEKIMMEQLLLRRDAELPGHVRVRGCLSNIQQPLEVTLRPFAVWLGSKSRR